VSKGGKKSGKKKWLRNQHAAVGGRVTYQRPGTPGGKPGGKERGTGGGKCDTWTSRMPGKPVHVGDIITKLIPDFKTKSNLGKKGTDRYETTQLS